MGKEISREATLVFVMIGRGSVHIEEYFSGMSLFDILSSAFDSTSFSLMHLGFKETSDNIEYEFMKNGSGVIHNNNKRIIRDHDGLILVY